jgi:hypothetical protein
MVTLYPPSSSDEAVDVTPVSVFTGIEKEPPVMSYFDHENVKGAVPPGLAAVRVPRSEALAVQKMKTGSSLSVTG